MEEPASSERVVIERVEEGVFQTWVDFENEDVSVVILQALSHLTELDAISLIDDFSEYADPDALNRIFAPVPGGPQREHCGHVAFEIEGYPVTVYANGEITIGEQHE